MKMEADVVIVGTGVGGLFSALCLPRDQKIIMITKSDLESSDSFLAQGGICMLHDKDDYDSYFEDTMKAGHYENRKESVDLMIRSSREIIQDLIGYGVDFQKQETDESENKAAGKDENAEIQDIYADMRGLRHDLRGHINNITQYVKKQNNTDVEELNNYIRNMEETVSRLDFGYQTGNPITDIIIHQKKQEADRAGVKFSVDFSYPKELQIDVYDIGVILNNALENAIEAAAWLNRNKYVSLHSYVKGNLFFVEVENSFAREIVMNQESGLPESSKLNKKLHGMGLTNIQRCARKYKGDIDIVIGTSKQEQQIFNLTIMLNGKPVGP